MMADHLCLFCDEFERREIGFHQKRHEECRKKMEFIQKSNKFWRSYNIGDGGKT